MLDERNSLLAQHGRRFREQVVRLIGFDPADRDLPFRLGLAVSGGPDSMAMLVMAHEAFPGEVAAATVNHGLRPEAVDEAEQVARFAETLDIPHATFNVGRKLTNNVQANARQERYRLLLDWKNRMGIEWFATAHHADDQLETVLMRLARGSGVSGLAGIRATSEHIIRPMLGFTKQECIELCERTGTPYVSDPSNVDEHFDRVRMRNSLKTFNSISPDAAVRVAQTMAEADEALNWATAKAAETAFVDVEEGLAIDTADLPREIVRRLVLSCLDWLEPGLVPRGDAMDRLLNALEAGEKTSIGGLLASGGYLWSFWPAPPRTQH